MSSMTVTVTSERESDERQNMRNTIKATKYMLMIFLDDKYGKNYVKIAFSFSLLGVIPTVIYTTFPGLIINELTNEHRLHMLCLYICALIFTPVLFRIIDRVMGRKQSHIRQLLSANFRKQFNCHTAMLDYETIENPEIQDLCIRVGGTFQNAWEIVDRLNALFAATFNILTILSIIATTNIFIIFIVFLVIFVNSIISKHLNHKLFLNNKKISKYDRFSSNLMIVLHYISYAKEVRIFNLKLYFSEMLYQNKMQENEIHLQNKTDNLNAQILFSLTNFFQQCILYAYIVYRVIFTGLSIGNMSIYMSAVGQFAGSFNKIVNEYLELSKYSLDIQELKSFMEIPLKQYSCGDKIPYFDKNSIIQFKNVSFKYPGSERYALQNINITIYGDERLCIVGENGSGKSTFIKLLTRLYFPTEGDIFLNGINIKEYDYQQYQRLFAPVFQDFQLYTMSLAENIVMADRYNQERLRKVCLDCGLSDLVEKLPKKYETSVFKIFDPEGFEPSGGEGQRIAIARACYHGGEIFLLDEPTAALDPKAEYEVYTQFNNMITKKCAVLITHRLSAVQLADKIAVFDSGNMMEYGTHQELYAKSGIYTEMFDKQAQFYRNL